MTVQLLLVVGGAFVLGFFACYAVFRPNRKNAQSLARPAEYPIRDVMSTVAEPRSTQPVPTILQEPVMPAPTAGELLKRIAEASTYDEVDAATGLSSDQTVFRAGDARKLVLVTSALDSVATVGECLNIYDDTPAVTGDEEDVLGNVVLERVLTLAVDYPSCQEIIERFDGGWPSDEYQERMLERALTFATSFRNVLALCTDYDEESGVSVKIFKRALELASSTDEALELHEKLDADTDFAVLVHTKARSLVSTLEDALEMCEGLEEDDEGALDLLERALALATVQHESDTLSSDDLTRIFDLAVTFVDDNDDNEQKIRMRTQLVVLLGTTEEALELYGKLNQDYEDSDFSATVLDRALELAASYEECELVRDQVVTEDDDMETRTVSKMLAVVTTVEECESLWNGLEMSSNVARAAILRAADIIRANP